MKKLMTTAAVTFLVAGLAGGPAIAEPGKGNGNGNAGARKPVDQKSPALKLGADVIRLGDVTSFRCTAQVENATGSETVIESCVAYQDGVAVAQAPSARQKGGSAATERWTGLLPARAGLTVCVTGHALLTSGAVVGHYACD